MADDTTQPRRRKLPVLGMTTVGLAVGAGSLGLYRGATAEQTPPAPDHLTWTTAVRPAAPAERDQPLPPAVIAASFEEPAVPVIPVLPVLPPVGEAPALPVLPVIPAMPVQPAVPALPALPELPPAPVAPTVVMPAAPSAPAVPAGVAMPLLPQLPSAGESPAAPSPKVPDPVMPADEAKQWPRLPEASEVLPPPREVAPVPDRPMPALPVTPRAVELPPPQIVKPVAPPAQPVQIPAATLPVAPIVPARPELRLPPSQPSFTVNSEPVGEPTRQAPGVLSSLKTEPPGEDAVKLPLQTLKSAALGVALAAAPLSAAEPPPDKIAPIKADPSKGDPVADLKAEVQKLRDDAALERKFRLAVEDIVNGTRDNESGKSVPGLASKFADLDKRLTQIEERLAKFDPAKFQATLDRLDAKLTELGKSATTAMKPAKPADEAAPKPMPGPKVAVTGKASVRIVNEFPVPISLKVNGESHRLEPNASELVEVPAGDYTYELLNTGTPVVTRTLKESQSETLRIK